MGVIRHPSGSHLISEPSGIAHNKASFGKRATERKFYKKITAEML